MEIVGTPGDETLNGTIAGDIIRGAAGDDVLNGLDGDDQLWGGLGADELRGGDGRDVAVYKASAAGVSVDLSSTGPQSGGDAEGDRLSGIENLTGSRFDDILTGDAGDNLFRGAEGADVIDGGDGRDRASYAYSSQAVDIDLTRTGAQSGGDATGDVLIRIENVTGSDHDDHITGNAANNEISGGAGADIIDGGLGSDTVDYRGSSAVDVDLTRAVQIGGHAAGDQLSNIENLTGTSFADRLVGDDNANYISGDKGDDYIDGGHGYDYLSGGAGNDTVVTHIGSIAYGGDGTDTLVMDLESPSDFYGYNVSIDPETGAIRADYNPSDFFFRSEGIDGFGFERVEVHGSIGHDELKGTLGADRLYGNGGDDFITGGQGRDYLDGGDGTDRLIINYGNTTRDITVDVPQGKAYGYEAVTGFEQLDLKTGSGNDHIVGATGYNTISSGGGDDVIDLSHATGGSIVNTGAGADYFLGSSADDQVEAHGTGHFDGGSSNFDRIDLYLDDTGDTVVDATGGPSDITVLNFEQVNIFRDDAEAGNDTFRLSNGSDYVQAGAGDDHVEGFGGNDTLVGGAGNDSLDGGDGDDILDGKSGENVLTGGAGADTFHFSADAHTVITDFNSAEDTIFVARNIYSDPAPNFDSLMAQTVDTDDGALITLGADRTLLLEGVAKDSLTAADFT